MTTGYIEHIGKLLHQNDAQLIDTFEGCLIDNYLYQARRGVFALFESYVNTWNSRYIFKFARTAADIEELTNEFYKRMEGSINEG